MTSIEADDVLAWMDDCLDVFGADGDIEDLYCAIDDAYDDKAFVFELEEEALEVYIQWLEDWIQSSDTEDLIAVTLYNKLTGE